MFWLQWIDFKLIDFKTLDGYFIIHTCNGPIIILDGLKSIYNDHSIIQGNTTH